MDVEHEGVTIPRRRPRRPPVGLPYSPPDPRLEAMLEDDYGPSVAVCFGLGVLGGAVGIAGLAVLVVIVNLRRVRESLIGK